MTKFNVEAKVGLFFLIVAGAFAFLAVRVLEIGVERGFELKARLDNAQGLISGSAVDISGIKVGHIKSIDYDPETQKALVIMEIKNAYRQSIPEDSKVKIATRGLMGEKSLAIEVGKPSVRKLAPGEEMTRVSKPPDTEKLMSDASVMVDDLRMLARAAREEIVDKDGAKKLHRILTNSDQFTSDFRDIVEKNKPKIDTTLDNMQRFSQDINQTGDKYQKLAEQLDGLVRDVKSGRGTLGRLMVDESLYREARQAVADVRSLSDRLQRGPGTASRIINDPELYFEARRAIRNMNKTAEDVSEATPISTLAIILGSMLR